jgi:sugar phosphate isomerase/epimerase
MAGFGFRTGIFRDKTIEQSAAELARIGFDYLELCLEAADVRPETLTETRCAEIRSSLNALGIGIASTSYHADREPLDVRRANQHQALQATRWLGAEILILNAEKTTDRSRQWPEHVALLRDLCQTAEEIGISLAIEPEPLLVVSDCKDMLDMLEQVNSPQLKVNLDIGHAYITDDDLVSSIIRLGPEIVHLHLEDIKGQEHRHLPLGMGDIDFVAVRKALDQIDYQGPYVADLFGLDDTPANIAAQALAGLRARFQ